MKKITLVAVFGLLIVAALADEHDDECNCEYGDHFEGDMILSEEQLDDILSDERNGAIKSKFRWPNNVVPYELTSIFSKEQNETILAAMKMIEAVSCIKFVPRTNETGYIQVMTGHSCFTTVGYQGRRQFFSIGDNEMVNGKIRPGVIIHELLHALGFFHMHTAPDRDDYITINWDNIAFNRKQYFEKHSADRVTRFNTKYDYASIMHFGRFAYSANNKETIEPNDKSLLFIGQRHGMSPLDILKLNAMYQCDDAEAPPGATGLDLITKPYMVRYCNGLSHLGLIEETTVEELKKKDLLELLNLAIEGGKKNIVVRPYEAELAKHHIAFFMEKKKNVEEFKKQLEMVDN